MAFACHTLVGRQQVHIIAPRESRTRKKKWYGQVRVVVREFILKSIKKTDADAQLTDKRVPAVDIDRERERV